MNEIKIFENNELGFKVRTLLNPDGSISVNAEDTALGYGWTKTETKNGKVYTTIRWERMNGFSAECGFAHEWSKDDYIPESLFYMLGFKAGNDRALKYQQWLAMEVLPSLRRTGSYEMPGGKKFSAIEQLRLQQQAIFEVDEKIDAVNEDLQEFKRDMPLLALECQKITQAKNHKVVPLMGGKEAPAYQDRGLRGRVYRDLEGQLRREFGVNTYKAIKRNQCDLAIKIIKEYELPMALEEEIKDVNAQVDMFEEE